MSSSLRRASNTCSSCGDAFTTNKDRIAHIKTDKHRREWEELASKRTVSDEIVEQDSKSAKSKKGDIKKKKCGEKVYVSKRPKKTLLDRAKHLARPNEDTPSVLAFNELSGYELMKSAIGTENPYVLKMIPEELFLVDTDEVLITPSGTVDLKTWVPKMYKAVLTTDGYIDGRKFDLVRKSVDKIIGDLDKFIRAVNCPQGGRTRAFHCDLHPANIRFDVDKNDSVTQVYVIDFDMARSDTCDSMRSSTRTSGDRIKAREWMWKAVDSVAIKGTELIRGKKKRDIQESTLTDWAFFYTTCDLLYTMLTNIATLGSRRKAIQSRCM